MKIRLFGPFENCVELVIMCRQLAAFPQAVSVRDEPER